MKIKLKKENIDEYEMEVSEIVEGYINSEYEEKANPYRYIPVYINLELNSSFKVEDFGKIMDEYFRYLRTGLKKSLS